MAYYAYSRYNQIQMHQHDEEKTTFMDEKTNYCFKVMSFALKNARATYQHLIEKILQLMGGRNILAYVENMVVMSCDPQNQKEDQQ